MSGTALKQLLLRAQMRLADRSDACEGPGWARTEHMQKESGYVVGVPKMAAGAEAFGSTFLEDAGCWQASLQNARELLEAAGARERARVGGPGRRVDCPRAWLAPGSPEEGHDAATREGRSAGLACGPDLDPQNWLHLSMGTSTGEIRHRALTEPHTAFVSRLKPLAVESKPG